MDITFVPTPQDDSLKIEAAITKSAAFAGTTFDFGATFAPSGHGLPFAIVAKMSALSGTGTFTLTPVESDDDNTYTPCGPTGTLTLGGSLTIGTSLTAGVMSVPGFLSKRYVRGSLGLTGAGTITMTDWMHPLTPLL